MRKIKIFLTILALVLLGYLNLSPQAAGASAQELKPIELEDILSWKSITHAALSPDGNWLVYRLTPNEGDSEVVVRKTREEKEYRFPIGEAPRFPSRGEILFSEDSRWLAFTIYPDAKEARKLRREKKKVYNKAALLNLASGEKVEFEKIKGFAFSGENAA